MQIVDGREYIPEVRKLIKEYTDSLGRTLMDEILSRAKAVGFSEIVLDTLSPMQTAIGLYRKYGFAECEPYYGNPLPDVLYFKKVI